MSEEPQIVRSDYLSWVKEPAIRIQSSRVKFNAACLTHLATADYIHIAIYADSKKLSVIPVTPDTKHGIRWSCYTERRSPKEISCEKFAKRLYRLMSWNTQCRFKIMGKVSCDTDGKRILAFDLSDAVNITPPNELDHTIQDAMSPKDKNVCFGPSADTLSAHPLIRRFAEDSEIAIGEES